MCTACMRSRPEADVPAPRRYPFPCLTDVIPAHAGTQWRGLAGPRHRGKRMFDWIPACAGMTPDEVPGTAGEVPGYRGFLRPETKATHGA